MHLLCLAESEAQNLVKNFRIAARNARSAGFSKNPSIWKFLCSKVFLACGSVSTS